MSFEVSRDKVLAALDQFDRELRPDPRWKDWERHDLPKEWLIEHAGQRYPVRQVWLFATGASGADMGYLRGALPSLAKLGFVTVQRATLRARPAPSLWWLSQGARGATPDEAQVGDVVVRYASKAIRAIGRVMEDKRIEYVELGDRAVPAAKLPAMFDGLALDGAPVEVARAVKPSFVGRMPPALLTPLRAAVGEPWPAWAVLEGGGEIAIEPSAVFDLAAATRRLIEGIAAQGFVFEPWQIAAFVTALRTKPFAILAGVSGTGKSRLPRLVARATGGVDTAIPVRPDWTDSSDVIGYVDLQGRFRPGALLLAAQRARDDAGRMHLCVVDEMNLARVEHYFAEVLSRLEEATPAPLVTLALSPEDAAWGALALPPNLAIVGTVNMDESAHGFSRKVLDRAFTLELSDLDLRSWGQAGVGGVAAWPVSAWSARPVGLAAHAAEPAIVEVVDVLVEANAILAQAQLQVGYRTRDEVIGFVRNAAEVADSFVGRDGAAVAPLDLALMMKLLPRIAGGGAVRQVVLGLLGFATGGAPLEAEQQADDPLDRWRAGGRRGALDKARFPRTAARLCLMWERLRVEGFTSFWL